MTNDPSLLPGRLMRRPGPAKVVEGFGGVQLDDPRLADVLPAGAKLLQLFDGTVHAEGPVWQTDRDRLLWSDVSNRRLLGWYPDGHVEVVIDGTCFMNGNALDGRGGVVHCEHGRRCISRSGGDGGDPTPIVTHYEGRRLNSPNDVAVAADGAIWFTDPRFGLLVTSQGSLAEPELDHCSVYRFVPSDGRLTRMADFEQPNGLAFSPDGRTLYVTDTSRSLGEIPGEHAGTKHEVVAFDVADDGTLSGRRFFCHTDHGVPDGLKVDRREWVWTTAGDGVHIWSPARERLGFVPTPVVASNCAFGADGRRLFIAATGSLYAIDLVA